MPAPRRSRKPTVPTPARRRLERSRSTPIVRLDSPRALVEAVPHLVGFVPDNSLVAVFFDPVPGTTRYRSKATVRVELPSPDEAAEVWDAVVPGLVRRVGSAAVALVAWADPGARRTLPADDLRTRDAAGTLRQAAAVFVRSGLTVRDQILVVGDRFVSLECTDPTCCPTEGLPWDGPDRSAVSAETVVRGLPQPLPSREALHQAVAADRELVEAVAGRIDALDDHELERRSRHDAQTVVEHLHLDPRISAPSVDQTVTLLLALLSGRARDEAVLATLEAPGSVRMVWEFLTRSSPDAFAAAPASLVALAAYLEGDGAAANVALDRAHEALDGVARLARREHLLTVDEARAADDEAPDTPEGAWPGERPSMWDDRLVAPQGHPHLALVENFSRLIGAGLPPDAVEEQLRFVYTRERITRAWEG